MNSMTDRGDSAICKLFEYTYKIKIKGYGKFY